MTATPACDIEALADDAWLLRFGDRLDPALNEYVHATAARIRAAGPAWAPAWDRPACGNC